MLLYFTLVNSLEVFKIGNIENEEIKLMYIPQFISPEDCQHIINLGNDNFIRSQVISYETTNTVEDTSRTSFSYYLQKSHDTVIKNIEEKVAFLTNKSIDNIEQLQIVRYKPNEFFNEHHDWFSKEYVKTYQKQRQYTFFVYLNDIKENGETIFSKIDKLYKPKTGNALFWENCISFYDCHDLSLHGGLPPKEEIKYGLNIWITI
jgi:prolyl 4-hydroxylase